MYMYMYDTVYTVHVHVHVCIHCLWGVVSIKVSYSNVLYTVLLWMVQTSHYNGDQLLHGTWKLSLIFK